MSVRLVYQGRIKLPDLPAGCTTIYDAAMSLTDRNPRDPIIGFDGDHAPTWPQLRDWLSLHQESYDVFNELLTGLRSGALQPMLRVYLESTDEIDPFRTLIAEVDAAKISDARKMVRSATPPPLPQSSPRLYRVGPKPTKRQSIARQMVSDFVNNPEHLDSDTLDSLANQYSASRETVKKARADAQAELSRNTNGTPNTNN